MPKSVKLGGTASNVSVGKIAHGLMMITWRGPEDAIPDEVAFEAIKAGVDALPAGTKAFLNSAEFYGPNYGPANLELLARFYEKYPEYANKTFLSVKGGLNREIGSSDGSAENLRRSVDGINAALRGTKKLDLFEPARIDDKVPLEEQIQTLADLAAEGKFTHLGLSECKAETLRKAHAIYPITAVEIEVNLWSYEEETKRVIDAARELGVTVVAYSPLGRGFLTGTIRSSADLSPGDVRHHLSRFKDENIKANVAIADAVVAIAKRKGVTPAQLALAWVAAQGAHVVPIPGSSRKERTLENIAAADIELSKEELAEMDALTKYEIKGSRYVDNVPAQVLHLWG